MMNRQVTGISVAVMLSFHAAAPWVCAEETVSLAMVQAGGSGPVKVTGSVLEDRPAEFRRNLLLQLLDGAMHVAEAGRPILLEQRR